MMPAYDVELFDPPAPLARVVLRNPTTGAVWTDAPMLLDSGSDITLVPTAAVQQLGLTIVPDAQYELMGFDGSVSFATAVRLEMTFCRRSFRGQFLLVDQPWGILGRNVLNALTLLLDGPKLTWVEQGR